MGCLIVVIAVTLGQTQAPLASKNPPTNDALLTERIAHRIVKRFDFDERKLGNFEPMPMNWQRIDAAGYPRYLVPRFDEGVGHDAPPSFRLALQGGNVGAHYLAKAIPVHPKSDYRITAWIHAQDLKRAGAIITAYYLDPALRKIDSSERSSVVVRGDNDHTTWHRVVIDLPGGADDARWIGLSCRVDQPMEVSSNTPLYKPISHHDVRGIAWFDDITVMRLPRIRMKLDSPASIYLPGELPHVQVGITDLNGEGLDVMLDVLDADGETIQSSPLRGTDLVSGDASIPLGDLAAGWYRARLEIRVAGQLVSTRNRTFLRLNQDLRDAQSSSTNHRNDVDNDGRGRAEVNQGFGVIIDSSLFDHHELGKELLKVLSPSMVKIPLWRQDLRDEDIVRGNHRADAFVKTLHELDMKVIGVLEAPPNDLAQQYPRTERSLISILASDPQKWRPYLALILMRHGQWINAWQLGPEVGGRWSDPAGLLTALANVRSEIQPLIGRLQLVVPRSSQSSLDSEGIPADVLSLNVSPHQASAGLRSQLSDFSPPAFSSRWATIEAIDSDRYLRKWRLIEFVQRMIAARIGGMDGVFVRQPWHLETKDDDVIVFPEETFILLRTLDQTLGHLVPERSIWLGPDVHAWLFSEPSVMANRGVSHTADEDRSLTVAALKSREDRSLTDAALKSRGALVVWTDTPGTETKKLIVDLGEKAKQIDLWGNEMTPRPEEGGLAYSIGSMPVIIQPVSLSRVRMLSSFTVRNGSIPPTVKAHERDLILTNTHPSKLSGLLRLDVPNGWRIRPKKIEIDLDPGQSKHINIMVRLPVNQASGEYMIVGHLSDADDDSPDLTLRAPLWVKSPGLDVNVLGYRQGDALNIVQRITNRTDGILDLCAYMISPHHPRELRTIANLAAGQTTIREYRVNSVGDLEGEHIRLTVEQINGSLRHNAVLLVE